jgi:hypothetical protein
VGHIVKGWPISRTSHQVALEAFLWCSLIVERYKASLIYFLSPIFSLFFLYLYLFIIAKPKKDFIQRAKEKRGTELPPVTILIGPPKVSDCKGVYFSGYPRYLIGVMARNASDHVSTSGLLTTTTLVICQR